MAKSMWTVCHLFIKGKKHRYGSKIYFVGCIVCFDREVGDEIKSR